MFILLTLIRSEDSLHEQNHIFQLDVFNKRASYVKLVLNVERFRLKRKFTAKLILLLLLLLTIIIEIKARNALKLGNSKKLFFE